MTCSLCDAPHYGRSYCRRHYLRWWKYGDPHVLHATPNGKGTKRRHQKDKNSARAIVERALGKPLSGKHPVHHVNLDERDDRKDNLVVCQNSAYHNLLHQRTRAYHACGDANARRCWICKEYNNQADITVCVSNGRAAQTYHKRCQTERARQLKQRKLEKEMAA